MASVRAWGGAVAFTLLFGLAATASAEQKDAARASYDRATAAFDAGDYATAAKEYARADELAPHPVALRWAIRSAIEANNAPFGMNLVLRSEGRDRDDELREAVRQARSRFSSRVSLLDLACPAQTSCSVQVDGRSVAVGRHYVTPGRHAITFSIDGSAQQRWVDAEPAAQQTVSARAPGQDDGSDRDGALISPVFPIVGAVVTAGLAAGTIASGVDTQNQNDEYLAVRSQELFDSGMAAQDRTNVLIGVTAAAGVATLVLGALSIDWGGPGDDGDEAAGALSAIRMLPVALPSRHGGYAGIHLGARF